MKIYLGNLTRTTRAEEIVKFVEQRGFDRSLKRFLRKRPKVFACEVFSAVHPVFKKSRIYAVVQILPASVAGSVIERLNGAHLRGRRVTARKFFPRPDRTPVRESPDDGRRSYIVNRWDSFSRRPGKDTLRQWRTGF